jgi:hypothetical protein
LARGYPEHLQSQRAEPGEAARDGAVTGCAQNAGLFLSSCGPTLLFDRCQILFATK